MKETQDEAIAEVRCARKTMCDRYDNDPMRLLKHLRAQQSNYSGRVIRSVAELEDRPALRDATPTDRKKDP